MYNLVQQPSNQSCSHFPKVVYLKHLLHLGKLPFQLKVEHLNLPPVSVSSAHVMFQLSNALLLLCQLAPEMSHLIRCYDSCHCVVCPWWDHGLVVWRHIGMICGVCLRAAFRADVIRVGCNAREGLRVCCEAWRGRLTKGGV